MKYIISAGGTGGHIYPALEIATKLHDNNHQVIFIASKKKLDRSIIERENVDFKVLYKPLSGIQRKITLRNIIKNFLNLFLIVYNLIYAFILILKYKPDYTIGFGGYITYPYVYMASKFKGKTAIHEANSYPGLVNRKLSKSVDKVFYTFENSTKYFTGANLIYTSNPRIDYVKDRISVSNFQTISNDKKILFVGGSLGAKKLIDNGISFAKEKSQYKVLITTGERYFEEYNKLDLPSNVRLIRYLNDPIESFINSDVVVARSGATTSLELMSAKVLTIFVPSPNVVADHQTTNALEFSQNKMALLINEDELDTQSITKAVEELLNNQTEYKQRLNHYDDFNSTKTILKEING